ncbi:MAG TPA: tryptophan 7-halogenase [Pyrinomonadaceae bacterium]|jgi:flavin-dependent dehydrogenase
MSQQGITSRHDVVILGGGPAGAAAALSLRGHAPSLSVALVEQSGYDAPRVGETLPPTVQGVLGQLGVWETFVGEGHVAAYGTRSAWGSDELFDNEFIYHPAGRGWHLDRTRFDRMLAREAEGRGVTTYSGYRFIGSRPNVGGWLLQARSGRGGEALIEASFVIDATGRRAAFASRLGARKVLLDRLVGVSVTFGARGADTFTDTYTLVEAREEGWWYSALLPGDRVVVFCMSDADVLKSRGLNSADAWLGLLEQTRHTRERVRHATPLGAPAVHAAHTHRLERFTGDRWLAVGDAATAFDPLSSQGVLKSLRSGVLASYAVADHFKGSAAGLEKYEALTAREFEDYLSTRADFYGRERRWEDSPFWLRRHGRITLAPGELLRTSEKAADGAAFDRLSMHLPARDLKLLCRLCEAPRRAQDVVTDFKARGGFAPDRRIILALQYLVEEGVIRPAAA